MEHVLEMIYRESDGIISLTFGYLERPDQGHLLKNKETAISSADFEQKHLNLVFLFFFFFFFFPIEGYAFSAA